MSKAIFNYPQPVRDAVNAPYLDGWRDGKLLMQHCQSCDQLIFYPRPMCPNCWSTDLDWQTMSGRGKVVSYSVIHRPNHESFADEVPITLAEIMLDEGVALLGRVIEGTTSSGMPVRLANDPSNTARYPLPVFMPSS